MVVYFSCVMLLCCVLLGLFEVWLVEVFVLLWYFVYFVYWEVFGFGYVE